jgi:hypothetical protein
MHRAIVVVDIEGFGSRTLPHQLGARSGLYKALEGAFRDAGVPWARCRHEDRGDGVFVLVPPDIPKGPLVESLPEALVQTVRAHNQTCPDQQRLRLRMAVHAGEVAHDDHGVTSTAVNTTFRLVDAPPLKRALRGSPGVLALIVSRWVFDEVVRHSAVLKPATFRQVSVAVKETNDTAWVALPDHHYADNPGWDVVRRRRWPRLIASSRFSPVAWIVVGLAIGTIAVVLGMSLSPSSTSSDNHTPPASAQSGPTSTSTTTVSSSTSTTTTPASVTSTPAASRPPLVRWQGTVLLDSGMDNGTLATGWFLDSVPPSRAPLGDLGLACSLSCDPNQVVSNAIVRWDGTSPPEYQQCADLLNTHVGQRVLDVQVGSMACFGTQDHRVARLAMTGQPRSGQMRFEVTVWEHQ